MNELPEIYKRIEYLRNKGVKMKEIADHTNMAASVLSSLYSSVLPTYIGCIKKGNNEEEALDYALSQVNNVSKKRLLGNLKELKERLYELEPAAATGQKENPFLDMISEEMLRSVQDAHNYSGIYISYSLSSSSDCLKMEPFLLSPSDNQVRVGRISAYGEAQWGFGIMPDPQNFHCMLNENQAPQFTMVTIYLQIPFFKNPRQLRGLYIGQDYNRNPIARRILLIKESESTEIDEFMSRKSGLIDKEDFTPEQQVYYDYTCQTGDFIKMCTVPSLRMDESDLVKEKKMLTL